MIAGTSEITLEQSRAASVRLFDGRFTRTVCPCMKTLPQHSETQNDMWHVYTAMYVVAY